MSHLHVGVLFDKSVLKQNALYQEARFKWNNSSGEDTAWKETSIACSIVWSLNCITLLFKQNQTQQLRQQLEGEIKNQENVKKILQETRQHLEQTKEQVFY